MRFTATLAIAALSSSAFAYPAQASVDTILSANHDEPPVKPGTDPKLDPQTAKPKTKLKIYEFPEKCHVDDDWDWTKPVLLKHACKLPKGFHFPAFDPTKQKLEKTIFKGEKEKGEKEKGEKEKGEKEKSEKEKSEKEKGEKEKSEKEKGEKEKKKFTFEWPKECELPKEADWKKGVAIPHECELPKGFLIPKALVPVVPGVKQKEPKPKEDKPKEEKPKEEKPKEEKPKTEKPKEEKPKTEKPKETKPKTEKPKTETPKGEKPKGEKPNGEPPKGTDADPNDK